MPTKGIATGFMGRVGLANPNVTSITTTSVSGTIVQDIKRALNKSHGSRRARATVLALTGAAVGAASKAYSNSRIYAGRAVGQAGVNHLGGLRTVETVNYQTGVSTATDLTSIDQQIMTKSKPASYPLNKSGYVPGKIGSLI